VVQAEQLVPCVCVCLCERTINLRNGLLLVPWPSGIGFGHIIEVALHPARLVLRLVTVTSNQGQLSLLSSAGCEMSTDRGAVAVLCDREGNRRSGVAPAMRRRLVW